LAYELNIDADEMLSSDDPVDWYVAVQVLLETGGMDSDEMMHYLYGAYQNGVPSAAVLIAQTLAEDEIVPLEKIRKWLIRAADAGCIDAYIPLAHSYAEFTRDYAKVAKYALQALSCGFVEAPALLRRAALAEPYEVRLLWTPQNNLFPYLKPRTVRREVFMWLLVAHRRRMVPYLRLCVCDYIIRSKRE
jgi:TPR repeat protein